MVALLRAEVQQGKSQGMVFTPNDIGSHWRVPAQESHSLTYFSKGKVTPLGYCVQKRLRTRVKVGRPEQ